MAYTTVNNGSLFMNPTLYTGTGSTQSITGVNFQPDLVWLKKRSAAGNHYLFDVVRGAQKNIHSNENFAEVTEATTLTAFGSDGFTLSTDGGVNQNGATFASWNWKANGAGSVNYNGTITSTVSVNATSGFSIVKYVGTGSGSNSTVGHGLGVTPSIIIVKSLDSVADWVVWNKDLPSQTNNYLRLNTNQAIGTTTNYWNSSAPTNQVFGVSPDGYNNNKSGEDTVAYCFNDVQGFSKSGSYTGNGNDSGPFVYTGFKPSFVMIKRTDGTASWLMFDNKRANPFNEITADLRADLNNAEDASASYNNIDFLSNGFKIRKSNADINGSGATYIYMAFASAPLVGTNNIPANAR